MLRGLIKLERNLSAQVSGRLSTGRDTINWIGYVQTFFIP